MKPPVLWIFQPPVPYQDLREEAKTQEPYRDGQCVLLAIVVHDTWYHVVSWLLASKSQPQTWAVEGGVFVSSALMLSPLIKTPRSQGLSGLMWVREEQVPSGLWSQPCDVCRLALLQTPCSQQGSRKRAGDGRTERWRETQAWSWCC